MTTPLHETDDQKAARRGVLRQRSAQWRKDHPTYRAEWGQRQNVLLKDILARVAGMEHLFAQLEALAQASTVNGPRLPS